MAALLLAFLGGPCAMQDVLPSSVPVPTKAEYLKKLHDIRLIDAQASDPAQVEAMVDASLSFLQAQHAVRARFATPRAVFSLFLVIAYMALFIFATRTWRLGNENAARLSKAALVALPARVAVAAIELAHVVNLKPSLEALFRELSLHGQVEAPVSGDALLELSSLLGQSAAGAYLALFWVRTLLVVALLYAIHRHFDRADVQALFAREVPDDEDDGDGD